tara:strand:+ start:228 stop:536 length:309 start_codon:yes stop_codon:yes gene_type:complete
MIRKFSLYGIILVALNGCIQTTASFIGPAYTIASTGNVYQAGLSVTINQALVHTTGEDAIEHVTKILDNLEEKKDNKKNSFQTDNNHQDFINSVKSAIRNND